MAPAPTIASAPPGPALAGRTGWFCLGAALAVTVVWFLVYNSFFHSRLVDEGGHVAVVVHIAEGRPGWPPPLTMLPGYHNTVVTAWQLFPWAHVLSLSRFVTMVFALAGLGLFAWTWRRLHASAPADAPGRMALLLALLPILQPFTGMAYTDVPALTMVLAAFAAHFAGRPALATLLFAAAAYFRQTNLLWPVLLAAGDWLDPALTRREWLRRHLGHGLLLLTAVVLVLKIGRLTPGTETGTAPRPNIATLHSGALLVLLLGLPVWLAHLPGVVRQARARPGRALALALGGLALATVFALTFANPHVWNRDLFWAGEKFTLLRNWPLVWTDTHPWLRALSGLNIVLMLAALALVIQRQPLRRHLWLTVLFAGGLPFTNNLVEPRYFIPLAALLLLFLEIPRIDMRRLTVWWAALCLVHAPFVVLGLSLW